MGCCLSCCCFKSMEKHIDKNMAQEEKNNDEWFKKTQKQHHQQHFGQLGSNKINLSSSSTFGEV